MPLAYIKDRFFEFVGITSPDSNPDQVAIALDYINDAAKEIYEDKDLPVVLKEVYLQVNSNKEISLPPFVGEPRAIRSTLYNDVWTLRDMRPRYHGIDWVNGWKGWRIKGESPTAIEITNAAPGTIEYPVIDNSLVITLMGITTNSNRAVDQITVSATSIPWIKSFIEFKLIKKNKITDYDVIIKNAAGTEIAIIYADQLESRYVIVDVSQYPSPIICDDGTYIMELLYKPALSRMENDNDVFPITGFDDIIVKKAKQLWMEEQPGMEQRAIMAESKTNKLINRKVEDRTGTVQHKIRFGRNQLLGIFRRQNQRYYYRNFDQ